MKYHRLPATLVSVAGIVSLATMGCGSSTPNHASGDAGTTNPTNGNDAGAETDGPPVGTGTPPTGASADGGGQISVQTALPTLPTLLDVSTSIDVDGVNVRFSPVDGAQDYRIYPLPADGDISTRSDGTIVVKNGTYRCAGAREDLYMLPDQPQINDDAAGGATILNGAVDGYTRTESDNTLGYVYTQPGDGRLPIYVVADTKEGDCGRPQFTATRVNTYTTDSTKRDMLVANHGRDDGIAFYVPASAGSNTRPVYESTMNGGDVVRWIDGPEATSRGKGTTIFNVLTSAAADTAPLMRVFVEPYCMSGHDELVAGTARYAEVKSEGDQPATSLHWSGITSNTVFVVEALDQKCPYQGDFSPEFQAPYTDGSHNFAFVTVDNMRSASPSGEVFINGQSDSMTLPKAIARSFVSATPAPTPAMDYYDNFQTPLGTFTDQGGELYVDKHLLGANYDFASYGNANFHFGTVLGELWFTYQDVGADAPGKVRLTPLTNATLAADTYLHVTTSVDFMSTPRRYPQILVSDQAAPVQDHLASGTTLVIQPKDYAPTYMQLEICDHRSWDVNNQCPLLPTFSTAFAPPVLMPSEYVGLDRTVKLDAYVSTSRVYVLLNDHPYACTNLPATAADGNSYHLPTGQVTVTLGDVLYHSDVDLTVAAMPISQPNVYAFHLEHMQYLTRRHFDNFGFKSGSAAPNWDETLFPCVSQ